MGLMTLLPDFAATDKRRLRQLGVSEQQLLSLRFALAKVRAALSSPATRTDTLGLLQEIKELSDSLSKKLGALVFMSSAEYGRVHTLLEERYWAISERQNDDGATIPLHLIPRLTALSVAADLATEAVPAEQARARTGSPEPVESIDFALFTGWLQSEATTGGDESETLAASAFGDRALAPYPRVFVPSAAEHSPFREIVGICYRTVGGNPDPLAAIRAFLALRKKQEKAAVQALERGIARARMRRG